jgi:hypothetical protein
MHKLLAVFLCCVLVEMPNALAAKLIRDEAITFPAGTSSTNVPGKLKGYQIVNYLLDAKAGQSLTVQLRTDNPGNYFNVLPPDSEEAIFNGSTDGNQFVGTLPVDGQYRVRTYLIRSAARRKERASYELEIALGQNAATQTPSGYEQDLDLLGIHFKVSSSNQGSLNQLKILSTGLNTDTPIDREIDGSVTSAEVADLNQDGAPEIYVYVTSAGSGSYASLVAYAANDQQSLSEIQLPPLTDDPTLSKGYMGHDQLSLGNGVLQRRFPLYRDGDSNAAPSGGSRQIDYRLVTDDAGWQLRVADVKDS